jgi:hypothetical protein
LAKGLAAFTLVGDFFLAAAFLGLGLATAFFFAGAFFTAGFLAF